MDFLHKKINELTIKELEELNSPWADLIYAAYVVKGRLPQSCHNRMTSNPKNPFSESYIKFINKVERKNWFRRFFII